MSALALLFFYHSNRRVYVGIALGIFLIDRLIYQIGIKGTTFPTTAEIMEDGETVPISASFTLQSSITLNQFLGRNIIRSWQPSDHVFACVPSMGRKHMLQAHPFTIISPASRADDKDADLELLIRAQRDFSSDLPREAMESTSLTIRIDGPYGSITLDHYFKLPIRLY